jgi:hypothetical protein
VPVVVDASAQGDIVNENVGFKIPVTSANQITAGIADAIIKLAGSSRLRISMGQFASDFVARTYRENKYVAGIEQIYDKTIHKLPYVG